MKKIILIVVAVLVLGAGGVFFLADGKVKVPENCQVNQTGNVAIMYTPDRKFLPPCVEIRSGDKITFINNSGKKMQVAANPHPLHTGNKEISGGKFTLEIEPARSAQVTLTKNGAFGYHDHLHSESKGVLIVK